MAEKVIVEVKGPNKGYTNHISAREHELTADEPKELHGEDLGPTPYELLLSALGACTSMTLRMYADRKGWPLEEVEVVLSHQKVHAKDCAECESGSRMLDQIQRDIKLHGDLTEEQQTRLLQIANKCPVHKTLTSSEINVRSALIN